MKTVVCAILICAMAVAGSSATMLLPNPKTDYTYCSRAGPSRICDPDGLLTRNGADRVEQIINVIWSAKPPYAIAPCRFVLDNQETHGFEVAVAIRTGLMLPPKNVTRGFQQLATLLTDLWGLGNTSCQTGVLVLVDTSISQVYISRSKGMEDWISKYEAEDIVLRAQKLLRQNRFDEAVKQIVEGVGLAIAGQYPREPVAWILFQILMMMVGVFAGYIALLAGITYLARWFKKVSR